MKFTHVMTPIRVADVEIRNRVARSAHGTLLGAGTVNDDLIAYHVARGKGGTGLSILETLAVHWSSAGPALNIFSPGIDDGYRRLVDAVRPTGMKLFQQLWHAGHNALPFDGSPCWSASDLPSVMYGIPAMPMTKAMIDEVVEAYADTARKMMAWGIEGVEVHAGHGYLPSQFLLPSMNNRTDDYGGPFENRVRFLHEVMVAVRNALPGGFPVGVRLSPDALPGGFGVGDNLAVAEYLSQRNLIDFIDVSLGNWQTMQKTVGGMHEPVGYELPTSTPITRAINLPSIVTGRFRTLEEADQVIRAGDASMVSFTRAMIADPELVAKTIAGHPEQVRPCIGCNQSCIGGVFDVPYRIGCAINPGAGHELTLGDDKLVPAETPKRVLVVGGRPAGMEAARVAALRGHKVTLAEARVSLGGAVLAASRTPTRLGMKDFTIWLEGEIYRLGVEVRMSTYMEADDVLAEGWDAVIVATGSRPRMDGLVISNPTEPALGMDQPHVFSSHDLLLEGSKHQGTSAVVIDDNGHYEALGVAEFLAEQGLQVNFVTRFPAIAPKVEAALMIEPALVRLSATGFTAHTRARAVSIGRDSVTICPTYLPAATNLTTTLPADIAVFVSLNRGNRELHDELQGKVAKLSIVGDASSARHLPTAVREGHLAGAEV